jgi:hypothetical protein
MKITGKILSVDTLTPCGEIYPRELIESELLRLSEQLKERRFLGTFDTEFTEVVDLTKASHIVTDLRLEGNDLIADIDIFSSVAGENLKKLIGDTSVFPAIGTTFFPRGLGSYMSDGKTLANYELISVDAVPTNEAKGDTFDNLTQSAYTS